MSSTRVSGDSVRVQQQLEIQTYAGRYHMDVPGNGMEIPFFEDPQVRLQRWGANLFTETTNVESDLLGLTRKYCRDDPDQNNHQTHRTPNARELREEFPDQQPFVIESRAQCPVWNLRGIEIPRWESPILNPQAHVEKDFVDNIQTRILEKDYFVRFQ